MKTNRTSLRSMDEYISACPTEVQEVLQKIRRVIALAAPDAEETIKYRIPTFVLKGNLIHFGAFQKHIGLYPAPRGVSEFDEALSAYEGAKGTVRFPLDQPIPYDLIRRIVEFRVGRLSEKTRKLKR